MRYAMALARFFVGNVEFSFPRPAKGFVSVDERSQHVGDEVCDVDSVSPSARVELGVTVELALEFRGDDDRDSDRRCLRYWSQSKGRGHGWLRSKVSGW